MKSRFLRRFLGDSSGAAAVEFSIVVLPFLMLIFGVEEFGRLMWTREALQETAISGARCMGVLNTSCASAGSYSSGNTATYIESVANNWGITLTSANMTLNRAASCAGVTNFSSVSLTYTFQTPVPEVLTAIGAGAPITVNACFPNNS